MRINVENVQKLTVINVWTSLMEKFISRPYREAIIITKIKLQHKIQNYICIMLHIANVCKYAKYVVEVNNLLLFVFYVLVFLLKRCVMFLILKFRTMRL